MKILHVIANLAPCYGGPSKVCVEMAQALVDCGHEVDVFTTDQNGPGKRMDVPIGVPIKKGGVTVYYFRAQTLRVWHCVSFSLWKALRDKVPEYDIVHIHSLYLFHDMAGAYFCRKYDVPYLIRPCGALDPYIYKHHRWRKAICDVLFENRDIRNAAAIHFTTEEEKQLAQPFVCGTRGVVAPLGLHLSEYEKLPASGIFRTAYPELGNKKIILFFSRINFKKGLDILIDSFAKVIQDRDDVHLVLAGPDNDGYEGKVKGWARGKCIEKGITFTGMLQGEMKLAVLHESSIFVLPSYTENFGISVIEAMACGLPVVISNKVNIWREVESAGAGLVSPCDAEPFSRHMLSLLQNYEGQKVMGNQGKRLVKERFSWPVVGKQLDSVYKSVIKHQEI